MYNKQTFKIVITALVMLFCIAALSQLPKALPAQNKLPRSISVVDVREPQEVQNHVLRMTQQGWNFKQIQHYYSGSCVNGCFGFIVVMEK